MSLVYISGPITGKKDYNKDQFLSAEKKLIENGYQVYNPLKINNLIDQTGKIIMTQEEHDKHPREYYLRNDIMHLLECDYIYYLPESEKSEGSKFEKMIADTLKILEPKLG
jgi:hypothetical protein